MIVRPTDSEYLLISQLDHARIAAEIAREWRPPSELTDLSEGFQFAVAHHDDGWREWEQAPTINGGAPRNFMDMPMPVATGIWSASVDVAAANSPWGGLWVSGHFCHLADLAVAHRSDPTDRSSAERFIAEQSIAQWEWRAALGIAPGSAAEVMGLHGVQFFDRLSLWLCCDERTTPQEFIDPAGETTTWSPESPSRIQISGEGFALSTLTLTVSTVAIPQRTYASDVELRAAISTGKPGRLSWVLAKTH